MWLFRRKYFIDRKNKKSQEEIIDSENDIFYENVISDLNLTIRNHDLCQYYNFRIKIISNPIYREIRYSFKIKKIFTQIPYDLKFDESKNILSWNFPNFVCFPRLFYVNLILTGWMSFK